MQLYIIEGEINYIYHYFNFFFMQQIRDPQPRGLLSNPKRRGAGAMSVISCRVRDIVKSVEPPTFSLPEVR